MQAERTQKTVYAPRIETIQWRRAQADATALQQQSDYAKDAPNNKSNLETAIQAPAVIDENADATANAAGKKDPNQHSKKFHILSPVLCNVRETSQSITFGADR